MPRVAFISDLHLGGYNTLGPDKAEYRAGVAKILRYLHEQGISHLVLLGDILDNWAFPRTELPLTYEQMLDHPDNAEPLAALKAIATDPEIALCYCKGNHDFDLPDELFQTRFPATQMGDNFTLGFVWGEHGHRFDLFNACPDPQNLDPAGGNRPLGYYITRIHTKEALIGACVDNTGRLLPEMNSSAYLKSAVLEARRNPSPIDEIKTRGLSQWTVATLVLYYVMKDAGLSYEDTIKMPDGSEVTIQQVSDAYKDLYIDWQNEHGILSALNAVLSALEQMDASAQIVRNDHGKRLVAFGHSHEAKWNPMTVQVAGKGVTGAYINDGAMCKWPQTAVIVDYLPITYKIRRLAWDDGGTLHTDEEEISNTWKKT